MLECAAMLDVVEVRSGLKALMIKRLWLHGVTADSIMDDESLVDGRFGFDSIDMLELALAIEEEYGVKVDDEHVGREAFQTINSLADFVCRAAARAGSASPSD